MTPYYDEDGITLFCADARQRRLLPDIDHATVLVTDPPYGVDFRGKATKHTTKKSGGYTVADSVDIGPEVVNQLLPMVDRAAVFPGNRNLYRYPEPRDIGCVYCPSGAGIGPWGFTLFHPVLFYGPRASNVLRPTSMQSFATAEKSDHPCPKPLSWMKWVLGVVTRTDDVVIDPFAGSGTTLIAARERGLKAIGIEIEERYCEIAVQRLAQGVLEFR